jgi:hypothetical protein
MLNQVRGSNVFLQADLEAMLQALLQTPRQMAQACPHDQMLQAWYTGYLAACTAIATMTGCDISPRTRRGARQAEARGGL